MSGVAASLTTLGADDVGAYIEAFLNVLWVANHVHVENAILVQAVDDVLGGDTDCGDKELRTGVNDYSNELVEFSLGVVITRNQTSADGSQPDMHGRV